MRGREFAQEVVLACTNILSMQFNRNVRALILYLRNLLMCSDALLLVVLFLVGSLYNKNACCQHEFLTDDSNMRSYELKFSFYIQVLGTRLVIR